MANGGSGVMREERVNEDGVRRYHDGGATGSDEGRKELEGMRFDSYEKAKRESQNEENK